MGKNGTYGLAHLPGLAHKLRAEGLSNNTASLNLESALSALRVTQVSLDEIASLNQRLAELDLNSNNALLSSQDTAALNQETAQITSAIDDIVSNTKYNNIALLGQVI